jgi:hypothetical protein
MRLVLDAEAVNALLDPRHPAERKVRRAMEAARRLRREVAIATGTLAELYRGRDVIRPWMHSSPGNRAMGCCSATPVAPWLA